jgi:hypothetical protein
MAYVQKQTQPQQGYAAPVPQQGYAAPGQPQAAYLNGPPQQAGYQQPQAVATAVAVAVPAAYTQQPVAVAQAMPVAQAQAYAQPQQVAVAQAVAMPMATQAYAQPVAVAQAVQVQAYPQLQQQRVVVGGGPITLATVIPQAVQPKPAAIGIAQGASSVKVGGDGKKFREYTFNLTIPTIPRGPAHVLTCRHSSMRAIHSSFTGRYTSVSYPNRSLFNLSNFTTNEKNCNERAGKLTRYLSGAFNGNDEGAVLVHQPLAHCLAITPECVGDLATIAAMRKACADEARAIEAARLAAIAAQQRADYEFAQTFTRNTIGFAAQAGYTTIAYPRQQTFKLRARGWSDGDADISGPGEHRWFRMMRQQATGFWDSML